MNRRIVSGLLGYLTLFCGAAMVPPFILAATAEEFNGAAAFLLFFPYVSGIMAPTSWLDLGKRFLKIWY